MYTALYPAEVAGLVFIDPPDFMLTDEQDRQIRINSGSGKGPNDWVAPYEQSLANDTLRSLKSRHRFQRLANLFRKGAYWEYRSLAGRIGRENFLQLIKDNHDSFFMLLPGYPHSIHGRDPGLVDALIECIYRKARNRQSQGR